MRLLELFDQPIDNLEWEETMWGDSARFSIGPYTYSVDFVLLDDPHEFRMDRPIMPEELSKMIFDDQIIPTDISFDITGASAGQKHSYGITGTGNEVKVFSTVINIIKQWLAMPSNNDVQLIHISAKEPSRTKLYKRMIGSLAKGKKVWELITQDPEDEKYTYWIIKL
jgi:hypothetical protein